MRITICETMQKEIKDIVYYAFHINIPSVIPNARTNQSTNGIAALRRCRARIIEYNIRA